DPHRAYVSGIRGAGPNVTAALLVSTDDGAHWSERAIPINPAEETGAYIAAVDPARADRVYIRTSAQSTGRLLVTDDAGLVYQTVSTGAPILGFALSGDGSRLYVGGKGRGLEEASSTDFVFTRASDIDIECLLWTNGRLYACSNEKSGGFLLGASEN